jgi:hypothetical protein
MDSAASGGALESNASAGYPVSALVESPAVTGKRAAEGEAAVGSDDEEVSSQSTRLAELSCQSDDARTLGPCASTKAPLAPPARNFASFGYMLQLWLGDCLGDLFVLL